MGEAELARGELESWRVRQSGSEREERAARARLLRALSRAVRAAERAARQAAPLAVTIPDGYGRLRELAGALGSARRAAARARADADLVEAAAQADEALGALERAFRLIGELVVEPNGD